MTTIQDKRCLGCGAGLGRDSLSCEYCGTSHVVISGGGLGCACSGCGAGNTPSAKSCVQCRAPLGNACSECTVFNPLGARFCQECRIEFRTYRDAEVLAGVNRLPIGEVEETLVEWLDSRWFKARDLREKLRILEKTLVWVPRWQFTSRVTGSAQGQVSQTHYRTKTSRDLDDDGKWVESVHSVPYTVWDHVNKDFDQQISSSKAAAASAGEFNRFLEDSAGSGLSLTCDLGGEPHERVFQPDDTDLQAYRTLRAQARRKLHSTLLEKVERLEVRYFSPHLTLVFTPVWQVVYRYKSKHASARIHGSTGRVDGKRLSLLSQWFA